MSFTSNQTGVEQGVTQVLFPHPPRVLDPYAETAVDAAFEIAIAGNPVVVQYEKDQAAAFLRLGLERLTAAMQATLKTLADAGGVVVVKYQTGTTATVQCAWAPASMQTWETYVGRDHPEKDGAGAALDGTLTMRKATLVFLRLE